MSARDEGDTLRVNDPLAEFIRAQQQQGELSNQSHDEFLAAYEEHVKNNRGGDDDTHSEANTEASASNTTVAVASRPIPKRPGTGPVLPTTAEAVSSSSSGSISNSKGGSDVGDEVEYVSSSATTSPSKMGNTTSVKSIVLKFTTLSDACTEAPSFSVNTTGATIGRSETNEVCVPSDAHLVPVGHASIEYSNGSFFLLDGGFDYPASIRVGASCSMKSTWRLENDARFSAGSSIFWCRGVNEAGELLVDIIDGPLKGESRVINSQGASIGRASENSLAVPDRELSRKHSRIEFDAKANKYVLVDLGSTNGTYMQLVGPYGGRYRMTLNDHILVGRTGFSINRFDYGLSEEMGHRQTMEDACAIVQHLSIAPLNVPRYSPQSFFGVYDGHGGAEASAYLSQYLHINVSDALLSIQQDLCALDASGADQGKVDELVVKALKTSFLKTDEDFISTASQAHAQHGSTATTGLLLGQRLFCANVGDSRTLLCRNFQPRAMSTDHKPNRPDEAERIRNAGGFVFNNRVMGELAVSRAFGDCALKLGFTPSLIEQAGLTVDNPEEVKNWDQPLIIAEPDIEVTTVTDDDQFFLLACDGLFDVFTPEDVIAFVRSNMEEHGDTQRCCQNLTFEAIRKRNSRDNVSVILIILNKWW